MFDEVLKLFAPFAQIIPTGERVKEVIRDISDGVEAMNYRFVQSRQRVTEFSQAIGDSVPLVEKLGGNAADVSRVIDGVAAATRRNVVASSDEITKLFAAQKLTGTDAQVLVDKFQNVGIGFSQIGTQLEGSIKYIQSVGGNARDIMSQVNGILETTNKYNFQDGVLGLTRMATQAQLLKFDMNQTLVLAEKALSPEGAIELASAFQRLGVSAGDLTDPFQLMNKALTDPEGLQNSLIEVTKKYTYFDEKAKSFKINPEGMLMLREIGSQAGLNSAELSKMALNAADLDDKLSKISPSFEFENEQDKQYIANIAKMGAGGEYEITVKNEKTGKNETVLLQEASNKQLEELLERQKEGQEDMTLEKLQQAQLDLLTLIQGELISTRDSYLAGVASSNKLVELLQGPQYRKSAVEGIQKFKKEKGLDKTPEDIRNEVDKELEKIYNFSKDFINTEGKAFLDSINPILTGLKVKMEELIAPITAKVNEVIDRNRGTGGTGGTPPPPPPPTNGRASGGYVYGEGTSTSDSIPTLLSNGEFVVNAESTEVFGALLERINENPNFNLNNFTSERLNNTDLNKSMAFLDKQNTNTETENNNVESNMSTNERLNNIDLTKFMTSLNPPNIPPEPKSQNTTPNNFVTDKLELKNTNDIAASNITNRSITEQISNLNTSTANTEMKTSKVEFGEISPLKVIFEKGPGFSDSDMAMLEYNLGKSTLTEQLTKSLSEKLKILQVKDS